MRQASGSWGRMPWPRCAVRQGSVRRPGSLEVCSASQGTGKALDMPSYRAHGVYEGRGGELVAPNNLHSPGDERL
jgi:hypothetical protein